MNVKIFSSAISFSLHTLVILSPDGDKGFEPKPNPRCVLRICEKMGVSPEETVMIGDTRADTEMGKKARLGCTIGK